MIIEIRRAGFVNKGAHLMQLAILKQLRSVYPDALLTMVPTTPTGSQPFRKLVDAGFYPKAWLYRYGVQWGRVASLVPARVRDMYGVVLDRDVDVVLDAAGFAYGGQWGAAPIQEMASACRQWRRRGTRVILLPQAFGPFGDRRMRRCIREIVEHADLVIPREAVSYRYIVDVVGERDNIRQYPDFTNLIEGQPSPLFDPQRHRVCLVPNYRMIDKTSEAMSARYLPFMKQCARYLASIHARPFVLVHEGEKDRWIAEQMAAEVPGLPILQVSDPLQIKGVLGACHATVGSRFHGLVSALSQGVPSMATGWSHKYQELFGDYGVPDWVVAVDEPEDALMARLHALVDASENQAIRVGLAKRSARLKALSRAMWADVFDVLR